MSTGSRGRKLRMVCGIETAYGAGPANGTFGHADNTNLANNGLRGVSSPNPVEPRQNFIDFIEHSNDYDEGDTISGIRTVPFSFTLNHQGGATATGLPRHHPLLLAAGLKHTVGGSNVVYQPVADTDTPASLAIAFELDNSWVWETRGAYVNIIMRLTPNAGWQMEVRGEGKWGGAPTPGTFATVYKAGWSGGTSYANKVALSGSNRFKINNGGSDYFPVWKQLTLDLGWRWIQDESMNAPNLLDCLLPESPRQMRATVDVGMDNSSSAAVDYADFFEDADDGTEHEMEFRWADRNGIAWKIEMEAIQNQSPRHTGDSRRVLQVGYKLRSASDLVMTQAAA